MMRDILFRGKELDHGYWVKGMLVDYYPDCSYIKSEVTNKLGISRLRYFKVDPETVGQYIGLDDGYGNKLFEGDIVYDEIEDANAEVIYFEGKFWLKYRGHLDDEIFDLTDFIQVIGNRHDNPELIKFVE